MTAQPTKAVKPRAAIDGRRLRSETSRLRIVDAMIALSPTAHREAETAKAHRG